MEKSNRKKNKGPFRFAPASPEGTKETGGNAQAQSKAKKAGTKARGRKRKKPNREEREAKRQKKKELQRANSLKKQKIEAERKEYELALKSATEHKGTLSDQLNPAHQFFNSFLKENWKSLTKKERKKIVALDASKLEKEREATRSIVYPFPANTNDHCETSPRAFSHIAVFLDLLANRQRKKKEDLKIYDPYFCAGGTKKHLGALGFPNVYNECVDFYDELEHGRIPEHDVVVTNPPYSAEHVQKLLDFVVSNKKPFFLLLPNYVCAKHYYRKCLLAEPKWEQEQQETTPLTAESSKAELPLLLCPRSRYYYWTPKGLRTKLSIHHSSTLGIRTSPYISFWYMNMGTYFSHEDLFKWWQKNSVSGKSNGKSNGKSSGKTKSSVLLSEKAQRRSLAAMVSQDCILAADLNELPPSAREVYSHSYEENLALQHQEHQEKQGY